MTQPRTIDELREQIARMAGIDPAEVDAGTSLMDLGLDSMRAMTLVQRWNDAGLRIDFAEFVEDPTLAGWWAVLARAQRGDAAS